MTTKFDDMPLGGLSIDTIGKIIDRGYCFSTSNLLPNIYEICLTKDNIRIIIHIYNGRADEVIIHFKSTVPQKCTITGHLQFELYNGEKLLELLDHSELKYHSWIDKPKIKVVMSSNLI